MDISQKDLDAFDKQMSAAEASLPTESGKQEPTTSTETTKPEAASPETPTESSPAESTAQTAQTDKPTDTPKPEAKQPSKYEKAQARQNEAWKKLEADKEAVRQEKEAIARERAELAEKAKAPEKPKRQPGEFFQAAEDIEARSKSKEANGDFDGAEEDKVLAKSLRKTGERLAKEALTAKSEGNQPASNPAISPELNQAQLASLEQAKKDFPELGKTGSQLNLATQEFIKANPEILQYPKGPYLAAEHVSLKLGAARAVELAKELDGAKKLNQSLTEKVKELESLTSVEDGGVTATPSSGPRSFNELSTDEMRDVLTHEFQNA